MTSFQAAVLSCRLLALYVVFHVLSMLSLFPLAISAVYDANPNLGNSDLMAPFGRPHTDMLVLLSYLLPFLLLAAFAAFLWVKAGWLAARIAAVPASADAPLTGSSLQRILLTVIGVFVLALAVPEAARAVAMAVLSSEEAAHIQGELARTVGQNWSLLLRFALGFGLLFGAPAISAGLDKLHTAN